MNKRYIDNLIVVEGKNDASLISSLFEVEIIPLNGYECNKEDLDYINEASKLLPVIILTDSDSAGKSIRNKLHSLINNYIDVEVDISKCNKRNKHGVAECNLQEINRVLQDFSSNNTIISQRITNEDVCKNDIDPAERTYLSKRFKLGRCNNKTFIKRLNRLGVTIEVIKKELKSYGNQ